MVRGLAAALGVAAAVGCLAAAPARAGSYVTFTLSCEDPSGCLSDNYIDPDASFDPTSSDYAQPGLNNYGAGFTATGILYVTPVPASDISGPGAPVYLATGGTLSLSSTGLTYDLTPVGAGLAPGYESTTDAYSDPFPVSCIPGDDEPTCTNGYQSTGTELWSWDDLLWMGNSPDVLDYNGLLFEGGDPIEIADYGGTWFFEQGQDPTCNADDSVCGPNGASAFVELDSVDFGPVLPEPGTLSLFGAGLVGLGMLRYRRRFVKR